MAKVGGTSKGRTVQYSLEVGETPHREYAVLLSHIIQISFPEDLDPTILQLIGPALEPELVRRLENALKQALIATLELDLVGEAKWIIA